MDNNFWWQNVEKKLREWNVGKWGVNPMGVGRIAKSIIEGKGYGGPEDNWYSGSGNQIQPDPYTMNEVYDARGVRYVFYRGNWVEDDPLQGRAYLNPVTGVALGLASGIPGEGVYTTTLSKFAGQQGFPIIDRAVAGILGSGGRWAMRNIPAGTQYWMGNKIASQFEKDPELYYHQLPSGEYVGGWDGKGGYSELIKPGTWQWIVHRWGDNPPPDVVDKFLQDAGVDPDVFDATPLETKWLNNPDQTAARVMLGLQDSTDEPVNTLVRFSGPRQYAITLPGEGDRWKYVIQKDAEGNWVRVYRRTWGAKKEKELKKKAKGKD